MVRANERLIAINYLEGRVIIGRIRPQDSERLKDLVKIGMFLVQEIVQLQLEHVRDILDMVLVAPLCYDQGHCSPPVGLSLIHI